MRDDTHAETSQFFWLMDELDYGVILIDRDLKILWVNKAMEDLFTIRRQDIGGMDFLEFVTAYLSPAVEEGNVISERVRSSIKAGLSVKNVECRLKHPKNNIVWLECSSQLVDNGPFAGMRMDIFQDITLRKQLEEELSLHFGHLGEMIETRTAELTRLNEQLQLEINEKKKAEDELRRERDFSANLVRSSPAFFVAIDPGGHVIMMNESMLTALGYEKRDVGGRDFLESFVPERERAAMASLFERIVQSRDPFMSETRLLARDGRELLVEWHGRPVFRESGDLDYFFAVGTDITERARVERALRSSENLYRTIFETTGSAMIIMDEDQKVILANTEFERLFGYALAEMKGKSWPDLVAHDDVERVREYLRGRRRDPSPATAVSEFHLMHRDGSVREVVMTIGPIPDTTQSVASLVDITEQKHAAEEVRQQNRQLSTINQIIAAAADADSLADLLAVCLEKTRTLLEFDAGAIYIIDPAHRAAVIRSSQNLPDWFLKGAGSIDIHAEPNSAVFIDGKARYIDRQETGVLSIAMIPFRSNGEVIGALYLTGSTQGSLSGPQKGILESISSEIGNAIHKRRLQEQLEASYRESTLYLDIISHDINNANNVSIMYAELLTEMLEGDKREIAEKLVASIRRSIDIIGNVSKIRKLYEEKAILRPIDLDALIRSEIRTFPDAHIAYEGPKVSVAADYLLAEVFANLIGNSLKFGGPDVAVTVRVAEFGDDVEVTVEDTGPGIPDRLKPLIFNRFQRGETKASGKGLGLYLSRMLVDRYGGAIWVQDRVADHPEKGAAIRFRLRKAPS
jgi:PAS domain S-box-containing protein